MDREGYRAKLLELLRADVAGLVFLENLKALLVAAEMVVVSNTEESKRYLDQRLTKIKDVLKE